MNRNWTLNRNVAGFKKGSRWILLSITLDGWYMETCGGGVRSFFSNVSVFDSMP